MGKPVNKSWLVTFKNAWEGCVYALKTQRNFKIHFFLSFLVLILAFWLEISFERRIILVLAIFLGLAVEMGNTAFEKTVDLVTEEWNPKAKIAKDVSAGMMLTISLGLAIVGLLILWPPLWLKLFD